MSAKEDWKAVQEDVKEHRGAWKRVMRWALIGCAVMALATLAFCVAVLPGKAKAATVNLDCPTGSTWTWLPSLSTLSCVPNSAPTPPDPTPPVVTCPTGSVVITGRWGTNDIQTSQYGNFGNNFLAVQLKVPTDFSGSNVRSTGWVEYQAGSVARYAVLSTQPCDLSDANAVKTPYGPVKSVDQIRFTFSYSATGGGYTAKLLPGVTYWVNVKNQRANGTPTCSIANCSMRGGIDG